MIRHKNASTSTSTLQSPQVDRQQIHWKSTIATVTDSPFSEMPDPEDLVAIIGGTILAITIVLCRWCYITVSSLQMLTFLDIDLFGLTHYPQANTLSNRWIVC